MPYYLVQAGTSMFQIAPDGNVYAVTLPAAVTVNDTRRLRAAILDRDVVLANALTANVAVSAIDLTGRRLNIDGPSSAPSVAAGASGNLSGEYRYMLTFAIVAAGGRVLTESPFSTASSPITVSSSEVELSAIETSETSGVNARMIYRTTKGGTDYFLLATINDNVSTTYTDNTSDYDLALLPAADDLGNAPGVDDSDRIRLLVAWKDRLWASPANAPDRVHYSANRKSYAWSPAAYLTVKPVGQDLIGVTAFIARRDDLLVGKRRALWMIRGTPPDTIQMIQIFEGPGPVSQDACVVIHDIAYYLGEDGVYEVTGTGIRSISESQVHSWFTTDVYFNRSMFEQAFAKWNPLYNTLEVHLAAAGSSSIDRWVSYDLGRKTWLGPHKTDAFTPTYAGLMDDAYGRVPVLGGADGYLYRQNVESGNDAGVPIEFDLIGKFHTGNTPDIAKYWGELSVISRLEGSGTLSITPRVGGLDAGEQSEILHDLTKGRQRLRRLGTGRFAQLRFRNVEPGQAVELYGYELPYHELGRR